MTRDQALMEEIQYALLEPPDRGESWPSGLWAREEVLDALSQRQNRLIKETQLLTAVAPLAVAAADGRPDLPEEFARAVAFAWVTAAGVWSPIEIVDALQADYGRMGWPTEAAGVPLFAYVNRLPTLTVQLIPAPAADGTLEALFTPIAPALDGDGIDDQGDLLLVPDECAHGVKYGALAVLLRKHFRATDLTRAAYCEQRYELVKTGVRLILEGGA